MKKLLVLFLLCCIWACKKKGETTTEEEVIINEDPASYSQIASVTLSGAAEITAYDQQTKKLFAINNGILAVAIESANKQAQGKVVLFNTTSLAEIKTITVGALPDMVVWSPDGKLILTANEGEPDVTYTNDPEGSISIIRVDNNYEVTTLNFASFAAQLASLSAKGFRVFGPGKDIVKDVEPEYITVSPYSKTAWVTLQENNAVAVIDLTNKMITKILPLGFKDYNTSNNAIDPSDRDNVIAFTPWKIFGTYMPDAITSML